MLPVHHFDILDSTNRVALELAVQGEIHGACVTAQDQTQGRGRLGKSWHSAAGKGLYFSLIVRPCLALADYPKITLAAGLGVAEGVDMMCGTQAALKWPNDLFLGGRKCGGILSESGTTAGNEKEPFAVVGIGLNCRQQAEDFPEELRFLATSLRIETGKDIEPVALLEPLRDNVLGILRRFEREGFAPILDDWRKRDFLCGKELQCVNGAGQVVKGIALGPNQTGELQVRDGSGQIHTVITADIRLATKSTPE